MIKVVNGEIYNLDADDLDTAIRTVAEFFSQDGHENDVVAVREISSDVWYISRNDLINKCLDKNAYVHFSVRMFKEATENRHIMRGGIIPAINELGEPVCLLSLTNPVGFYLNYEQEDDRLADVRVFSLYDNVVLTGVVDYAFVLLNGVLKRYDGRVICVGRDWEDFKQLLPGRDDIEYYEDEASLPEEIKNGNTMYLSEFCSIMAGYQERCRQGIFSYDEIMALVYMFSRRVSCGNKYPEKKFFLVDPVFTMEGLMSICDKLQTPYAYAQANGYIPVIRLTQSEYSVYSDQNGEDIWGKFFVQPYGNEANEWVDAANVFMYPFSTVTFSARWLMHRIMKFDDPSFMNTRYMNQRVRDMVDAERKKVLTDPEHTIGVLIRGTDYTVSHLPGHSVMATPEQVMDKIKEFESTGKYNHIFLSTEDASILETMKQYCGDRLSYTDQRRFDIKQGELLADKRANRDNDGWLRGEEYLTTLELLSECGTFIASGGCCGTTCVMNTAGSRFKDTYVFSLGNY
ncbi:MAG: hypothetical protein PUG04_04895 [Lachnospiraceae bacterium]|nr:hypothetical protein [Lachnospiraceae bacterium]